MRKLTALLIPIVLASCGTLPQDGPSSRAIARSQDNPADPTYAIVDLNYAVSEVAKQPAAPLAGGLTRAPAARDYDLISVGDTLAIAVLEPGGALFGSSDSASGAPTTTNQGLPPIVVDRAGLISVPFAGSVRVAGLTVGEAGDAVRRALRGKAVNPQVILSVQENTSNGVTVMGAVTTPGRLPLKRGVSTALDVIAAAGGPTTPPEDIIVTLVRDGQTFSSPLSTLFTSPSDNIVLSPGDQINLVAKTRRYTTFGALSRVSQVDMPTGDVTLAGALAAAGGLNSEASNARAVLVFRFERPEVAHALGVNVPPMAKGVPVIYRLDLSEPAGFFTANNFMIRPEDVIYNPRANSAELRKFFEFVQSITRVIYDVTVTGTLNVN